MFGRLVITFVEDLAVSIQNLARAKKKKQNKTNT